MITSIFHGTAMTLESTVLRAIVGVVLIILAGSILAQSAEPLRVEPGLITDAVADSSGVRVFKGIPFACHQWANSAGRDLWL
jgi:hypothetical protein